MYGVLRLLSKTSILFLVNQILTVYTKRCSTIITLTPNIYDVGYVTKDFNIKNIVTYFFFFREIILAIASKTLYLFRNSANEAFIYSSLIHMYF